MKTVGVVSVLAFVLLASAVGAAPPPAAQPPAPAPAPACCRAPAGTQVMIELAEPVGTKLKKSGDSFALRLAAPLVVNGQVLLRAGTPGEGTAIQSSGPGFGGKAAKLVLSAGYLTKGRTRIRLEGLQLAGGGKGNVGAAEAIGISGIVLGPVGFVGMAVRGGNVEFPAGTQAVAKLTSSVTLASLGPASKADRAATVRVSPPAPGSGIGPPPRGMGQVVFFRGHSLLGTAQWFNVRENGQALGKLTNGAYFVETLKPGLHVFTATSEPEFKDSLMLKVDPGETYYVEGQLTKGLVIGAADLVPSDAAAFAKAAKGIKGPHG